MLQIFTQTIANYIDALQANGIYTFTSGAVKQALKLSDVAFNLSIHRLIVKKRIVRLRHGFFVIVPLEYKFMGAPPPSWYIDFFMRHNQLSYYVGLLSAAALHGAAHQQPQEFQVITTQALRPINLPKMRIKFFVKRKILEVGIIKKQTETGNIFISSPELTALDLVRYFKGVGHFNNIVTVLIELAEQINPDDLVLLASCAPLVVVQRLGYLLEKYTHLNVTCLYNWLKKKNIRSTPLCQGMQHKKFPYNARWKVYINGEMEPDI